MPSTIPYDPSLTLASVVNQDTLRDVEGVAAAQAPADNAKDALNSLIASRRSLSLTKTELEGLGANTENLVTTLKEFDEKISKQAKTYVESQIEAQNKIQTIKEKGKLRMVHASMESPVDLAKTETKELPLAADSMNMDVQYFSFDENEQDSATYAEQISKYISVSTRGLGQKASAEISDAGKKQIGRQMESHTISGTLVVAVTCTHKKATLLAPFVMHVDKAIKIWNSLFPNEKLDSTSKAKMHEVMQRELKEKESNFSIISGTTFGSSFVGMVHVLNVTDTRASQQLVARSTNLQARMDAGAWLAKAEGKFGVDASFASDVKNMLSTQNVSSHVTLLSMGLIPSMVSNNVKTAVKEYKDMDPAKNMAQVAAIQNATIDDQSTIRSAAEASRSGERAQEVRNKEVKAVLSAIGAMDDQQNKMLDVNSLMVCLDDYLKKASNSACGVPINYYLKSIDQKMLAEMWFAKYFPDQYMGIKHDEPAGDTPAATAATATPAATNAVPTLQARTVASEPSSTTPDTPRAVTAAA